VDGRWEGRYKVGVDKNGNTKYQSVYGHSYNEVKKKIKRITYNQLQINNKNQSLYFSEVLLLWLDANKIKHKGSTNSKYEYLIKKHIIPELGNIKVSHINTDILNDFMNKKLKKGSLKTKKELSPAYVRNIMFIISSAMNFVVEENITSVQNIKIHKPNVEKKELSILNIDEQKRLKAYLLDDTDNIKIGILISLYTGLRIGEICALTWDNIDFRKKILHVNSTVARVKSNDDSQLKTKLIIDKPKTKSSLRDIPLPTKLISLLTKVKSNSPSRFIISKKESFMSPRTYEYQFHRALDKCNIQSINYHALRHTFATRCIEIGMDVKTLSEILGHSNVSITLNTYVHPSMDLKRKQLEKLVNM
jgi:integrase